MKDKEFLIEEKEFIKKTALEKARDIRIKELGNCFFDDGIDIYKICKFCKWFKKNQKICKNLEAFTKNNGDCSRFVRR